MNPQDQYDVAMFDFSRDELDRSIAKLRTRLVVKPALYEAQWAFGMPHSLFYVKAEDKPKAGHRLPAHRPIGTRRRVSRQSGIDHGKTEIRNRQAARKCFRQAGAKKQGLLVES